MTPAFLVSLTDGPIIATAIHCGHELRPEIAELMRISAADRAREEDPHTHRLVDPGILAIEVRRSRFEVDLNRPREGAVYLDPDDAWGLEIWKQLPSAEEIHRSLAIYDDFYQAVADACERLAKRGPFVVLDLHSYNHRRDGADAPPADLAANPDVNIGTATVAPGRWDEVIRGFIVDLTGGLPGGASVAENVRFKGGHLAHWINRNFGEQGCAIAVEFKKTFMDEWTGQVDEGRLARLRAAVDGSLPGLARRLKAAA
ncbi:MAG TPA: N-formylglutamate amidohydrolase [Acidimicrobiia bacterium]